MPELAGGDEGEYVLRIRGESMKNAGILEGDYVVVRRQDTAADGEIVVALVGEDATVKRFFREDDHVRLQPENDDHGADPLARGARARPGGRRVEDGRVSAALARPAPARARARGRRADARRRARRRRGPRSAAGAATECPVCAGSLQPRWSAGAGVVGGRCGDCGTTLE